MPSHYEDLDPLEEDFIPTQKQPMTQGQHDHLAKQRERLQAMEAAAKNIPTAQGAGTTGESVGQGLGAAIGGTIGAHTGPAAPIVAPLLGLLGGWAGGAIGGEFDDEEESAAAPPGLELG